MATKQNRPSKLESVISFGILLVLIIFAVGLVKMQFVDQEQPADTLAPAGFEELGPGETYTENTLYNKINGKAPLYTDAGFVQLTTQRYINVENDELTFETYVYDMGRINNAFSVYSQQKRPDSMSLTGLKFGYSTENAAYIVHGKYYCEIIGASDNPQLIEGISQIAKNLPDTLSEPGPTKIEELQLFPEEGLVADSQKLYLKSAFGCAGLNNLFTAQYKVEDYYVTAFISVQKDIASAQKTFELYKNFLIENGGEIHKPSTDKPNPNVCVIDIFGLNELIAIKNRYVFGIHEFEPTREATKPFKLILQKLTEIQGSEK